MSTHDFSRWTPQRPPDDFADRMVSAMLAETPVLRRKRRGWLGGLGLAAVLLGASAWGMLQAERTKWPEAVVRLSDSARRHAPEVRPPRAERAQPAAPAPAEEEATPVRKVKPPPPKRKATSSREPLCHCEADLAVCGCLE